MMWQSFVYAVSAPLKSHASVACVYAVVVPASIHAFAAAAAVVYDIKVILLAGLFWRLVMSLPSQTSEAISMQVIITHDTTQRCSMTC